MVIASWQNKTKRTIRGKRPKIPTAIDFGSFE
jgi:hypothetical protein